MPFERKPISKDNWLSEYEDTRDLIREIIQRTTRRRQLTIGHYEYSAVSISLKKELNEADEKLKILVKKLELLSKNLATGEKERRLRLCETLETSLYKATEEFRKGMSHLGPFTKVEDLGTGEWNDGEETEITKEYSNSHLKDRQKDLLNDQDEALNNLSSVVRNQKSIAQAISTEVDGQDDLLIDISERVADNRNHLEQTTSSVTTTTRKSSTWVYWIVIVCLLIGIIIVAVC